MSIPNAFPDDHYHSGVPSPVDIVRVRAAPLSTLPGIELHKEKQLQLVKHWKTLYPEAHPVIPNSYFGDGDAWYLSSVMRTYRPKRYIEVGCGHSSRVAHQVNRWYLENAVACTFIDPDPSRLMELVDWPEMHVLAQPVQDVPLTLFEDLRANDLLFIDSSHMSKYGSDVNFLLFEVLPRLQPGVLIHFHDILYPFEYSHEWIAKGIYFNEAYLLHAFLMNNPAYEIVLWADYLMLYENGEVGSSLYLRKKYHWGEE